MLSCPSNNNNNKSLANCTLYIICCCSRCIHLRRALHCKLLPTLIVSIILCASTSKYAMRTKPLGFSEEAEGRPPCKRLLYTNYIIITTLLLPVSWYWWGCWGYDDGNGNKTLELAEGKLLASHYLLFCKTRRVNEKKTVVAASCLASKQTQQGRLRRSRRTRLGIQM